MRIARLGDLADIRSGGTPSRAISSYYGGAIPWAKISDIEAASGLLVETEEAITDEGLRAIRGRLFPEGTLFFAIYGSIGKMAFAGLPMSTNQAILGIELRDPRLDPRYLYHWLASQQTKLLAEGQGIAQKNLSAGYVRDLQIPLPPLDEQRRIAAILDQAGALQRKRREATQLLNHAKQSLLDELLKAIPSSEKKVRALSDLTRDDDAINYGVVQPGDNLDEGVNLIRVANVVNNDFSDSSLKKISPEIEAQYRRSRLRGGEILVACVGSVGAVAVAPSSMQGSNIARAVARIPANPAKIDRAYLTEYLKSDACQKYFQSEIRAVAQPTLNIKQINETLIVVPSLEDQSMIAEKCAQVDAVADRHCHSLRFLNSLFASLQHRAFNGGL